MKWYADKKYQEMCEKAEELQNKAKKVLKIPPKTITHLRDGNVCVDEYGRFWKGDVVCRSAFRIFSQEDLQEMITDKGYFRFSLIERFYMFATIERCNQFNSMTKLWLARVMHELYQKKWNPEIGKWESSKSKTNK